MYIKLKKALTYTSLVSLGISTLMLIAGVLFGLPVFSSPVLSRILFILATFAIAGFIALFELPVVNRKRILGFVGLALLGLSTFLALILFIVPSLLEFGLYARFTLALTVTSIMFIVIIILYSKLLNTHKVLQGIAYTCYSIFDIIILLLIAGINVFAQPFMITFFVIICIVNPALFVALLVLSTNNKNKVEQQGTLPKANENMITISKEEYERLKQENEQLKQEIEQLKQNKEQE